MYKFTTQTQTPNSQTENRGRIISNMNRNHKATAVLLTAIEVFMILLCAGWVSLWLLKPTDLWTRKWRVAENTARASVFGYYGILVCMLCSFLQIQLLLVIYNWNDFMFFRSQLCGVYLSCCCSGYNRTGLFEYQTLQATNLQECSSWSSNFYTLRTGLLIFFLNFFLFFFATGKRSFQPFPILFRTHLLWTAMWVFYLELSFWVLLCFSSSWLGRSMLEYLKISESWCPKNHSTWRCEWFWRTKC